MQNKLPKFFDNHKICIICEGNEEYEYLNRLKNLKVWNEQYDISLVNAGGNGNIPARYQDRYQNGADELVLVFCDTEKKPHEQYEDIKRKINEFHGVDSAANEVIIFGNRNMNDPKMMRSDRKIIPDLVIHRRRSNRNNLLVIEFKKKNAETYDKENDRNKLMYLTDQKEDFKYNFGLFVELGSHEVYMEVYQEGNLQTKLNYSITY